MKTCSKCGLEKEENSFAFKNKAKGTRAGWCKECQKSYVRKHYSDNKKSYIKRARSSKPEQILKARKFVSDYLKDKECLDCGEKDQIVLQFDHVRGEKEDSISRMVNGGKSIARIESEIEKCDIRCSNCHLKRHAKEYESFRWKNTRPSWVEFGRP